MRRRTTITDVVQGIIVGGVLAVATAYLLVNAETKAMVTTVNGWSTTLKCGASGNGILLRAACTMELPAANLPEEAVYWTATVDGAHTEWTARLRAALPAWGAPAQRCLLVTDHARLQALHGGQPDQPLQRQRQVGPCAGRRRIH